MVDLSKSSTSKKRSIRRESTNEKHNQPQKLRSSTSSSTSSTSPSTPLSPLNSLSAPKSKEEIHLINQFKNRTIERIISKKRDEEFKKYLEKDAEYKKLNFNRLKYRENIKNKQIEKISKYIDISLALSTLIELTNEKSRDLSLNLKKNPMNYIELYKNSMNIFHFKKLKQRNEIKLKEFCSGIEWLQNEEDLTSELNSIKESGSQPINLQESSRPIVQSNSAETQEKESLANNFLYHIVSYDLSLKQKLNRYCINPSENEKQEEKENPKMSSIQNKMNHLSNHQISQSNSPENNTSKSHSFTIPSTVSKLSQISTSLDSLLIQYNLEAEPRKLGGIFNKIIQNANVESIIPSITKVPTVDEVSTSFSMYTHLSENTPSQDLFSSLFDSIFILGPKKEDIIEAYNFKKNSIIPSGNSSPNPQQILTGFLKVPPSVLFNTENDYPGEMIRMLPSYCYPDEVEIDVNSTSLISDLPPTKKKLFNIKREKAVKKVEIEKRKIIPPSEPFLLTLGDHTYQSYSIVIPVPVTINDPERKVSFTFWYSLAVFTKFPFVNYLSSIIIYLMKKFDLFSPKLLSDFLFNTIQNDNGNQIISTDYDDIIDENSQFHYNIIQEIIFKFKKIQVPLFPFLKASPLDYPPLNIFNYHLVIPEVNYASAIIDIKEFTININNIDIKLPGLPRSMLQNYYSLHSNNNEFLKDFLNNKPPPMNDNSNTAINFEIGVNKLYDKIRHNFTATEFHKLEKDREEIYYILLWSLPTLINHFSVELILLIINAFISNELIILIYHPDIKVISKLIFAFLNLLRPLKWCYPIIITLSEVLYPLLDCPFPILIGMNSLINIENTDNYILVNAKDQTLQYYNNGKIVPPVNLPNSQKILSNLQDLAITIKRESSSLSNINFNNDYEDELKIEEESPLLLESVRDFMTIISDHILSIINTSIQLQKDSQLSKKNKFSNRVVAGSDRFSSPTNHLERTGSFYNSDIENYSLSSTSSSIPSVLPNVPSISTSTTDYDSNYVRKLLDTQMFTNICQIIKLDRHLNVNILNTDEIKIKEITPSNRSNSLLKMPEEHKIIEGETDAIEELFSIIVNGTLIYNLVDLQKQKENYKAIYNEEFSFDKVNSLAPNIPEIPSDLILSSSSVSEIRKFQIQQIKTYNFNNEYRLTDLGNISQCNGLLCNGFGNTYMCSNLCLTLWDFHVHNLMRVQQALDIISKKYEKKSSVEYIVKEGVRLEPQRHPKETDAQYSLRKNVIKKELQTNYNTTLLNSPKPARKTITSYILSKKDMKIKKRTYIDDSNLENYHFAKYFAKREKKIIKKVLIKNFAIIQRFIYTYIIYFKELKLHRSFSLIQAYIRGFLVRIKIPMLVQKLVFRKTQRFFAKIRIRNAIRNYNGSVYKNYIKNLNSNRKRSNSTASSVSTSSISTLKSTVQLEPFTSFKRLHSFRSAAIPKSKPRYMQNAPPLIKTISSISNMTEIHNYDYPLSNRRLSDQGRTFLQMSIPTPTSPSRSSRASLPFQKNFNRNLSFMSTSSHTVKVNDIPNDKVYDSFKTPLFFESSSSSSNNNSIYKLSEENSKYISSEEEADTIVNSENFKSIKKSDSESTISHRSDNMNIEDNISENNSICDLSTLCHDNTDQNFNNDNFSISGVSTAESIVTLGKNIETPKRFTPIGKFAARTNLHIPLKKDYSTISPKKFVKKVNEKFHENLDAQLEQDPNFDFNLAYNTEKLKSPLSSSSSNFSSGEYKFLSPINESLETDTVFPYNYLSDNTSPLKNSMSPSSPRSNISNLTISSSIDTDEHHDQSVGVEVAAPLSPLFTNNIPNVEDYDITVLDINYYPAKAFGPKALTFFTYNELKTIKDTWEALKHGVPVIKHCRKGKPKNKMLYSDVNMTKIYWKTNNSTGITEDDDSIVSNEKTGGSSFKFFRRASFSKFRTDREVYFTDMHAITDDYSSDVFQTSFQKNYFSNYTCNLSIFTSERTVDLELSESNFNLLYHGLKLIVNFYLQNNQYKPKKSK